MPDKISQNTDFDKNSQVPNGFFIGITVNFIIKKLKSKHLVSLSFLLWWGFFEGTRGKILHGWIDNLRIIKTIFWNNLAPLWNLDRNRIFHSFKLTIISSLQSLGPKVFNLTFKWWVKKIYTITTRMHTKWSV